MTYLWHVTLNTGHGRRSQRAEAAQIAVDGVMLELARALRDGETRMRIGPPQDADPPYHLMATSVGSALLATVLRAINGKSAPVATIGVAPRSRSAAKLWELMHETDIPLATATSEPPPSPWCAARLEIGVIYDPASTQWLGDWERLAAWAWIGRATKKPAPP